MAGLSRPMSIHDKDINKSIDLNIISASNLVKICSEKKKNNFFSTSYLHPGKKLIIQKKILCFLGTIMAGQN